MDSTHEEDTLECSDLPPLPIEALMNIAEEPRMEPRYRRHINIPLNEAGLEEYLNGEEKWNNVYSVLFREVDITGCREILEKWNIVFGMDLQSLNHNWIGPENLKEALKMLRDRIETPGKGIQFHEGARRLQRALEKGIEVSMPVFFDLLEIRKWDIDSFTAWYEADEQN